MAADPQDTIDLLRAQLAAYEKACLCPDEHRSLVEQKAHLVAEVERLQVQLALAQVEVQRQAAALRTPVTCPNCKTRFAREPLAEDAAALGRNSRGE